MPIKKAKQRDNAWWPLVAPTEKVKLPGPGALQDVREKLGLTQQALAAECGVSRDVVANYENDRTGMDIESALKVWRVLEVKERALVISREKESADSAADFLLGLLWYAKASAHKRLAEIDGQVDNLQRTRESIRHEIAEIETEETHLRTGFLGELLGKSSTPLRTLATGASDEEHQRKIREAREKMASIYGSHWEEVFGSLFDASKKNRDLEKRISELHDLLGLETKVALDREKIQAPDAKDE